MLKALIYPKLSSLTSVHTSLFIFFPTITKGSFFPVYLEVATAFILLYGVVRTCPCTLIWAAT